MPPAKSKTKKAAGAIARQMELMLEDWPERVRGIPNVILRSSLFSISQTRPVSRKLTLITSVDGFELRFKGEHFNQDDLDVWQALVHRARKQPLGTYVRFTVNEVLRELDRKTGGTQHTQLQEEIARLIGGVIEMRWVNEGKKLTDSLVKKSFYDEKTETYVLILSEELLKIYETGYTWVDWQERKLYKKNALAKWLHGFYGSHADPFAYKVETIRDLCGSNKSQRLTDFRKALRAALDLMTTHKFFVSAEIEPRRDVVEVKKLPTPSQRRHLQKRNDQLNAAQAEANEADFNASSDE